MSPLDFEVIILDLLNQAFRYFEQGDLVNAQRQLLLVLKQFPQDIAALNLIGIIKLRSDQVTAAIGYFNQALEYSSDKQTLMNLALAYIQVKKFTQAMPLLKDVIEINPKDSNALNALGNIYRIKGEYKKASQYLKQAYELAPNNPQVFENIAWLSLAEGNYADAMAKFNALLKSFPRNMQVKLGLAKTLLRVSQLDDALSLLLTLDQKSPGNCEIINMLGVVYNLQHQVSTAKAQFEKVLSLSPDHSEASFNLGNIYEQQGNAQQAATLYLKIISVKPLFFEAYFHLCLVSNEIQTLATLKRWQTLWMENKSTNKSYMLAFALGRAYERKAQYKESFQWFSLAREQLNNIGNYNFNQQEQLIDQLTSVPNRISFEQPELEYNYVFIVGMPRSGTTLTEQILASHQNTVAIGESGIVKKLADRVEAITQLPFYQGVNHLTAQDHVAILALLKTIHQDLNKNVVVDSSPMNIHYLGFILQLLPAAKFVICQRSPMDTCLSIFQHPLNKQHNYANNLEDLGRFYKLINKLIEYSVANYPKQVINLYYEKLVAQPSQEIDALLLALELPLDSNCYQPEKTQRVIRTPSANQVNKKINSTAIGRWHHFKQELQPLLKGLKYLEEQHDRVINS
jgi:tetratricopeptide (TPR) repeat protein